MRTLTRPGRESRSLAANDQDGGAILVLVAVLLVALIGAAAIVLDIGNLAVEKREVQNGTDAAALAVAQDCALGSCGTPAAQATTYLDLNAEEDDNTELDVVCGVGPGLTACPEPAPAGVSGARGWVRVRAGAPVDYLFAPVMGPLAGRAEASSVVAWGSLGSATANPLTFSVCEFQELGGNVATGRFPTGLNHIYFHGIGGRNESGVARCTASPSGQDLPGGFGWLQTGGSCATATVVVGDWVRANTGNSVPSGCTPRQWVDQEILITLFDQERGTGNNGEYRVAGFIGFIIRAYRFPGDVYPNNSFRCPEAPGNSGVCVRGEFTRFTQTNGGFGSGADFGATVIRFAA